MPSLLFSHPLGPPERDQPLASSGLPPVLGVLETDLFCRCCGYNLHGQRVWRDPRLELCVCRCPECGTHEAAGRSGIEQLWSSRVATIFILFWSGALGMFLIELCVVMNAAQASFLTDYLQAHFAWHYDSYQLTPMRLDAVLPLTFSAIFVLVTSLLLGAFAAIFLCHIHRWIHYLLLLGPIGNATMFAWQMNFDELQMTYPLLPPALWTLAIIQVALILIGILFGRPLTRITLRLLLHWSLLQSLGFLWHVDGLCTPGVLVRLPVLNPPVPAAA